MDTTTYRLPRISRLKAAIGALLAALAITGVVQAATAEPAAAMKSQCVPIWQRGWDADSEGREYLAAFYYAAAEICEREG